jgi:hypothetical protein
MKFNPKRNIVHMANVLVPQHMFSGAFLDAIETLLRTRGCLDYWNGRNGSNNLKEIIYSLLR